MPRKSPYVLRLTASQRSELEARARMYTLPYRDVVRARVVLMAADGLNNDGSLRVGHPSRDRIKAPGRRRAAGQWVHSGRWRCSQDALDDRRLLGYPPSGVAGQ